jgi:carbon storage regulator CsrA
MRTGGNRSKRKAAEVLVLNRKPGDGILIGDDVEVLINDVGERNVKVGIEAPKEVSIRRAEIASAENGPGRRVDRGQRPRRNGERKSDRARSPRSRGRFRSGGSAKGRRRVIIDPEPGPPSIAEGSIGERMLREALKETPPDVLEAVAQGDAVDRRIRRALMELAREELFERVGGPSTSGI